jgi:hypothetical protein
MKKPNRKDFIFGDQANTELTKLTGQVDNNSFLCRNLTDCQVDLCDKIGQLISTTAFGASFTLVQ